MGALENATELMKDSTLLELVKAGTVYQSRQVVIEAVGTAEHAARLALANVCIIAPDRHAVQFLNVIACDPTVAALGPTSASVPENTILTKLAEVWTPIAKMLYPQA